MKIKKRYIALIMGLGLLATCQTELLKFRKNDKKQRQQLLEQGQQDVHFYTYKTGSQCMHYTITGSDTLPLVLFVHGAPGSSSQMLDYLADTTLTKIAQVATADRPGYGYSGFGIAEPSLEKQALALKPILEKHGTGRTILVGHSFGGPVIARMAMDFPELTGGLILVAGSIDPELEPEYWWQKPLDWPVFRWMLPPAFRVSNQEILPLKSELTKMLPLWSNITCPVTVIQGTKDKLVDPGNAHFAAKKLTKSSRLEIDTLENKDHFIMWTERSHITKKITEMLELTSTNPE